MLRVLWKKSFKQCLGVEDTGKTGGMGGLQFAILNSLKMKRQYCLSTVLKEMREKPCR